MRTVWILGRDVAVILRLVVWATNYRFVHESANGRF